MAAPAAAPVATSVAAAPVAAAPVATSVAAAPVATSVAAAPVAAQDNKSAYEVDVFLNIARYDFYIVRVTVNPFDTVATIKKNIHAEVARRRVTNSGAYAKFINSDHGRLYQHGRPGKPSYSDKQFRYHTIELLDNKTAEFYHLQPFVVYPTDGRAVTCHVRLSYDSQPRRAGLRSMEDLRSMEE